MAGNPIEGGFEEGRRHGIEIAEQEDFMTVSLEV